MQKLDVEDTIFPRNFSMRVGQKLMDLHEPKVMGIVNITPDSFYSGSRMESKDAILDRVKDMLSSGADILDVGGYSTRPGANDISEEEETDRVCPAIEAILGEFPETIISIDTFRSSVAESALRLGATIVNDVSGFSFDSKLPEIAAKYNAPYILMHMRGTPQTMSAMTNYENLLTDLVLYFSEKIATLHAAGVKDVIVDPGFGFAKTREQNYEILNHLDYFKLLGCPILAGLSRKAMIYKKLGIEPEDSLQGTIALNAIALSKGASILRVHDVKEAAELVRLLA